ncbi:uncharacterized protein [Nicotiana tomentosiformis]|uniref:uncharacterized protein n=1 Tax=Nicotiana tomentosiformis TaxID=4098 RepID=UPI00388CD252
MSDDEQWRLERFRRLQPPSFSSTKAEDAQGFLDNWWEAYEMCRPVGTAPLTWQEFPILFLEEFVPQSRREELRREFEQLCQDDMSLMHYEMRFAELAHHVVLLVPTNRERIRRFIHGLTYQLQLLMTRERVSGATFDEVVDISRQIEMARR